MVFKSTSSKHFNELKHFTGLLSSQESYKPLRNSEIIKSEENVANVIHVLNNEYLNPLDVTLDKDKLFNLSSGVAKEDDLEKLLNIWQTSKDQSDQFSTKRILSTEIPFHDVIRRNKIPLFHTRKVIVKKDKTIKVISANRDIIGKLLILFTKHNKPVDLEGALTSTVFRAT